MSPGIDAKLDRLLESEELFEEEDADLEDAADDFELSELEEDDVEGFEADALHEEDEDLAYSCETCEEGPDYQVIGRDDRVRITSTKRVPFRYICKLESQYVHPRSRRQRRSGCTGTLIAPNKVLTAAHCVYDRRRGYGLAKRIRVIPAKNGSGKTRTTEPFGFAYAKRIHVHPRWRTERDYRRARIYDYAVITLDRSLGRRVGWFKHILAWPAGRLLRARLNTAGYPGDKGGVHQYWAFERVVAVRGDLMEYLHDTAGGQSGSAVWAKQGNVRTIVGVHTRADDPQTKVVANVGVRITPRILADIRRWAARPDHEADILVSNQPVEYA